MNTDIEKVLRKKALKIKITHSILTVIFWIMAIVFAILRESSKEVSTTSPPLGIPGGYTSVTYDPSLSFIMGICFMIAAIMLILTIFVFWLIKIETVEACDSSITFYRGPLSVALYINGIKSTRSGYFLEGKLPDGSTVTISLSRYAISAHMTFSNGHTPIDL